MSLRNNTLYNVLGSLAPAVAALASIPLLLAKIGEVRFGILALVWLLLGHFGVFDFGLSRATANRIARLAKDDHYGRRQVFWTSIWLNLGLGVLGAVALYFLAEPLMIHVFDIGEAARREILAVLPWIAAAVPLATATGVLAGALEGKERFDIVNGLQAMGAVIVQIAPVVAAYKVSSGLDVLIVAAVIARGGSTFLLFAVGWRIVAAGKPVPPDRCHARALFNYGAWISVSALIVPFFLTLDKFMIGSLLGVGVVAYYAVPDQLVRRISVLPAAVARSIFPRIAVLDSAASIDLSMRSVQLLLGVVTPVVVILILAMSPFLSLWIDPAFAARARGPGVLLAVGIWLNSIAVIPSIYLQATGRPNMTAKCHLIEILPHAAILWISIRHFGTTGAAAAMLIVTILDSALLMIYARLRIWTMANFWKAAAWIVAATVVGLGNHDNGTLQYGVSFAVAIGSAIWAVRTSPELISIALAFVDRIPVIRRGR